MYIFNKDRGFGRFGKNCDLNPQYLCIALFEFKSDSSFVLSFIEHRNKRISIFWICCKNWNSWEIKKKPTSVSTENAKLQLFIKMPYVNQHIHNRIKFSILHNEPFYTEALDIIIIQKIFWNNVIFSLSYRRKTFGTSVETGRHWRI